MASMGIVCSLRNFTETTSHLFPNPTDRSAKASYSRKQFTKVPEFVLEELQRNPKVTHLTLHHNSIAEIPPSFFNVALYKYIENLQVLTLHNNKLLTLPPAIAKAKQLRELNVEGNRLCLLPPELGELSNLEIFLAGRNKLRVVPVELTRCKKLRILDLSNNFLQIFPHEFIELEGTLKQLYLFENPLLSPPNSVTLEGCVAVMQFLRQVSNSFQKSTRKANKGTVNFDFVPSSSVSSYISECDNGGEETCSLPTVRSSSIHELEIHHAFATANELPAERVVELLTKRSLNSGIPLAESRSSWNMKAGKRGSIIFTLEELPQLGDTWVSEDEALRILRVGANTYLINDTIFKSQKGLEEEKARWKTLRSEDCTLSSSYPASLRATPPIGA